MDAPEVTSTRPYLIRALHDWCTDNGFTPYLAVLVDEAVRVPREYVKGGKIVLNVSFDATSALRLGNDFIEFKGRFAGTAREIVVPVDRVTAIYARENGQGMAFPVAGAGETLGSDLSLGTPHDKDAKVVQLVPSGPDEADPDGDARPPKPPGGSRPGLKRVK